ncbi:hypothetical protein [Pseudoduganella sp. RAF53_2]|uniref:hypothetical protein n=1 Tax=unclassified Pseudoduganella TaxID=2637179 RepID=UPI003F94A723
MKIAPSVLVKAGGTGTDAKRGESLNHRDTKTFREVMSERFPSRNVANATESSRSVAQFDFTNISPQKMFEAMNELIRDGKMTLDESSPLLGMIPTQLSSPAYDGEIPKAFYEPVNFFEKLREGMEAASSRNEYTSLARMKRAFDSLSRCQT